MDENRTRQKLDDLADLFLTGVVDDLDAMPEDDDRPHPAADMLQGPAPIRLAPKALGKKPATHFDDDPEPLNPVDLSELEHAIQDPQDPDDSHPMLRLTQDDDIAASTELEVPKAPAPARAGGVHALSEPSEPAAQANTTPAPAEPGRAVVEAVVMGNLPGLSGPWLTQYAQLIAQSDGPVAVLHIADEVIDLELVEPRSEAFPAPRKPTATLRVPPMRGGRTGLVGLLDALVRAPAGPVQTVLVRLEPTTDPRDLSRLAAIDDWTLLCGSDGSAIAGGRHMLQQLTHADPRLAAKHVGVMIMGSDDDAASAAADQLASSTRDLLAEPIEFIGHLQRMQPVQVRQLGSFSDPVSIWPQLVNWFDDLELPEPAEDDEPAARAGGVHAPSEYAEPPAQAAAVSPKPNPQDAPDPLRSTPAARPGPFHVPKPPPPAAVTRRPAPAKAPAAKTPTPEPSKPPAAPTSTRAQVPGAGGVHAPREPQPTPAPKAQEPATKPERAPTPTRPATSPSLKQPPPPAPAADPAPAPRNLRPAPRLDLASLLADTPAAIAGATPLDARIPHQRSAQLVVDDQGVIHILVRHQSSADHGAASLGPDAGADPRQAILDLIDARRWVTEHLELLALTQRDHDFVTAEPTLHLLTDRADLATGLVSRLGESLKLHLLQQVKLGGETGWFCTPLN